MFETPEQGEEGESQAQGLEQALKVQFCNYFCNWL